MYRTMIKQFLTYRNEQLQCPKDITKELLTTLKQLTNKWYDDKATTCIIKCLADELEGLTEEFNNFIIMYQYVISKKTPRQALEIIMLILHNWSDCLYMTFICRYLMSKIR